MKRVAYFFTTFPKLSERFFLREVVALRESGQAIEVYSMIGGQDVFGIEGVRHMRAWDWIQLILELGYWFFRSTKSSASLFKTTLFKKYGSWTNLGENWLGLAVAFRFARDLRRENFDFHHATWATAPGMTVYALKRLLGTDYTLEAHAYDVFRDGGDAHLKLKLNHASRVRSSTESTSSELRRLWLLAREEAPMVTCVRRGIEKVPPLRRWMPLKPNQKIRFLSVGRLIEKKGYRDTLNIFAELKRMMCPFQATIIGEGPLYQSLKAEIELLGLGEEVTLAGRLEYDEVQKHYAQADCFLFTGVVSQSGDRDGFPNVIGEAMSNCLPVFTTDVSGTTEGISDGKTGIVINTEDSGACAQSIIDALSDADLIDVLVENGHRWIAEHFSVQNNVRALKDFLWESNSETR